jgi:hypothetical protein
MDIVKIPEQNILVKILIDRYTKEKSRKVQAQREAHEKE